MPLSTAITRYQVPWMEMDWPLDWATVFGANGPVVAEIGFGNGEFLADMAAGAPGTGFVGVERSWASVQRLFRRIEDLPAANVRIVQGDAAFLLEKLFPPGGLDGLFINFPDPWPKERHHGRRLIHGGFLDLVADRLRPAGKVTIATDHAEYAAWIALALEGQKRLSSLHGQTEVAAIPGRQPTKYERKALAQGIAIHYFEWIRAGSGTAAPVVEKVEEMPNVVLEGPWTDEALSVALEPRTWQAPHEGVVVVAKLLSLYRQAGEENFLIEALVLEGAFSQHFGVAVVPRRPSRLLVKLAPMGYPRPTWGVKRAVRMAAEYLQEVCPGLSVVASNLA